MKPIFEKILPAQGSSINLFSCYGESICPASFWHFHPEYELVYIKKGRGTRHIHHHLSNYQDGDLLFLGPNIPHAPFGNTEYPDNVEIVLQFPAELLPPSLLKLPEFHAIDKLLRLSRKGLSYPWQTKEKIGKLLGRMLELDHFARFMALLDLLHTLAHCDDYTCLNVGAVVLETHSPDYQRINRIYEYVHEQYAEPIRLEEMSALVGLTETAFCRFFKQVTGNSFIAFLNEYRIYRACELLSQAELSITEVMDACGFNDLSYFSRLFKRLLGDSPREYRKKVLDTFGRNPPQESESSLAS